MLEWDVIVIGAGAAGLFCAIQAGKRGRRVLLLEHNEAVGKKIRISGGGRCNFTNLWTNPDNFISANPHFCKSALARYTPTDFIALVEKHGIAYHEKKLGQLFCNGSAQQIIDLLLKESAAAGVEVRCNAQVHEVLKDQEAETFSAATNQGNLLSSSLVIATGGLSIASLGATDFGYRIARQFGLKIEAATPALVPLVLLMFGATERMALILVIFGSAGSLLLPTMYGAQHVEPQARDVARGYRLRRRDTVWHILVPSAMPFIATGLRISATISLLLAIGAELIGGAPGLGNQISIDQQNNHIPQMYAYIVVCAALGAVVNLAMARLERRVIRWSPSQR